MSAPASATSAALVAAGGSLALAASVGCHELPPDGPDATLGAVAAEPAAVGERPLAFPSPDRDARPAEKGDALDDGAIAAGGPIRDAGVTHCPDDMVYVDTEFCADIERRCLDLEHEHPNNLEICHEFAREQRCRGPERRLAFCIDPYEYPNQKGGHPVWMLDWYEAQATCESRGKRLCWASEWTAACEGPEHTPFPYGFTRDHDACNMDNFYIEPSRPGPSAQFNFYSAEKDVAFRELSRLDQSVPSGSMDTCRSGFGVYDLTGNLDEWVVSDEPPRERSRWAGLKGGAWGHVRSQCRPMTYSHEPEFRYYFVGFRCCRDAEHLADTTDADAEVGGEVEVDADADAGGVGNGDGGDAGSESGGGARLAAHDALARWAPSPAAVPAPPVDAHDFAPDPIEPLYPPGPTKTKFTWVRKPDE